MFTLYIRNPLVTNLCACFARRTQVSERRSSVTYRFAVYENHHSCVTNTDALDRNAWLSSNGIPQFHRTTKLLITYTNNNTYRRIITSYIIQYLLGHLIHSISTAHCNMYIATTFPWYTNFKSPRLTCRQRNQTNSRSI